MTTTRKHRPDTNASAVIVGSRRCDLCGETIDLYEVLDRDGEPMRYTSMSGCPALHSAPRVAAATRRGRQS